MNSPVSQPKRNFSAVRSPKDITSENSISRYPGLPHLLKMSISRNSKNQKVTYHYGLTCDLFHFVSAGCCFAAGSPGCYVQKCSPNLTTYYFSLLLSIPSQMIQFPSHCPSIYIYSFVRHFIQSDLQMRDSIIQTWSWGLKVLFKCSSVLWQLNSQSSYN